MKEPKINSTNSSNSLEAVGNHPDDCAATHNMPSHITNRAVQTTINAEPEDFLQWKLTNKVDVTTIPKAPDAQEEEA